MCSVLEIKSRMSLRSHGKTEICKQKHCRCIYPQQDVGLFFIPVLP